MCALVEKERKWKSEGGSRVRREKKKNEWWAREAGGHVRWGLGFSYILACDAIGASQWRCGVDVGVLV